MTKKGTDIAAQVSNSRFLNYINHIILSACV